MKDRKLREFLGITDFMGMSLPISINHEVKILRYYFNRLESLERYLGVEYRASPSRIGYPKHKKLRSTKG
jgi:hypothetical protein